MRTWQIVAGLVVVLLLAAGSYFAWVLSRVHANLHFELVAQARAVPEGVELQLSATGAEDPVYLREVSFTREVERAWGLSAPAGFRVEALPLSAEEQQDPEMRAFAERFNAENVRWVSDLAVSPTDPTVVRIPAQRRAQGGTLQLSYRQSLGMGGSFRALQVPLPVPAVAAP